MRTVENIELAIRDLPWSEVSELRQWFDSFFEDQWDQKMRADAERGAFDSIVAEIKAEKSTGSLRQFP